ncbi:B-cell receptor CD22-like [Gouania willdenowi]|uniref:B-cell receptor CD22-like n=1 Tax=Gouania willdenowi TaxID=441366 RepID=UPI001056BD2F|nr:B-cell receptor CD22-like [Gouania willdenowi]
MLKSREKLSEKMLKSNLLVLVLFASDMMLDPCPDHVALFITAPRKLEALGGSCLQIPCNFQPKEEQSFNNNTDVYGAWIKHDSRVGHGENVVFNSSWRVQVYPMKMTGNLRENNCTTLFTVINQTHSDTFNFRFSNWPFRATASCNSTQITVRETPWKPTLEIPGDLKENDSVSVSCSALTPCPHSPPQLTWSLQQLAVSHTKENHDRTLSTKIQENITLSDQHDGLNISCSASYLVGGGRMKTSEAAMTLSVSYAPKDTSASISPSALVSAGSWVNLTCSSRAKPAVSSFSWFRISQGRAIRESEGHLYSFNVSQGGVYYCVATNNLGNQTSQHIYLSVHGSSLGAIIGGITATFILICTILIFWWLKSTRRTPQNTQTVVLQDPSRAAQTEEIHYGEIDFTKMRPKSLLDSSHRLQQQDVVYSQVRVNKTGMCSAQIRDTSECIYGQVKNK